MRSDLVVASETEASRVLRGRLDGGWPSVEAKGVDTLKLASLALILAGRPADEDAVLVYERRLAMLDSGGDEGPWVHVLPSDLIAKLAATTESERALAAGTWAASEELRLEAWDPDEVAALLDELAGLARTAVLAKKPILLWLSS